MVILILKLLISFAVAQTPEPTTESSASQEPFSRRFVFKGGPAVNVSQINNLLDIFMFAGDAGYFLTSDALLLFEATSVPGVGGSDYSTIFRSNSVGISVQYHFGRSIFEGKTRFYKNGTLFGKLGFDRANFYFRKPIGSSSSSRRVVEGLLNSATAAVGLQMYRSAFTYGCDFVRIKFPISSEITYDEGGLNDIVDGYRSSPRYEIMHVFVGMNF